MALVAQPTVEVMRSVAGLHLHHVVRQFCSELDGTLPLQPPARLHDYLEGDLTSPALSAGVG
jgi:hypothetical protein